MFKSKEKFHPGRVLRPASVIAMALVSLLALAAARATPPSPGYELDVAGTSMRAQCPNQDDGSCVLVGKSLHAYVATVTMNPVTGEKEGVPKIVGYGLKVTLAKGVLTIQKSELEKIKSKAVSDAVIQVPVLSQCKKSTTREKLIHGGSHGSFEACGVEVVVKVHRFY
jgi:hypothetical protein